MKTATIHITTTAENKNRWVRTAQRDGKKLGDWITDIIEAHMKQKAITHAEDAAGQCVSHAPGRA